MILRKFIKWLKYIDNGRERELRKKKKSEGKSHDLVRTFISCWFVINQAQCNLSSPDIIIDNNPGQIHFKLLQKIVMHTKRNVISMIGLYSRIMSPLNSYKKVISNDTYIYSLPALEVDFKNIFFMLLGLKKDQK